MRINTFCLLAAVAVVHVVQAKNVAVIIGGYGGGNSVEVITDGKTCSGADSVPNVPLAPAGQIAGWFAEYTDGLIYLCGGQDSTIHRDCYTLNIGDSNWQKCGAMTTDRRFAASTVMPDGTLVVLGGYNNLARRDNWLASVEVKAPGGCTFEEKTSWEMPRGVFDHCAVALNASHILVAGGNAAGVPSLADVNILNIQSGVWTAAEPLPIKRSAPGCILTTIDGEEGVMVTGGLDSKALEHWRDTQFYSLATGKWRKLEDMDEDRMGHALFHLKSSESVTLIGGYNEQLMGGIEDYTEGSGWAKRSGNLKFPRYLYGSCEVPESVLTC